MPRGLDRRRLLGGAAATVGLVAMRPLGTAAGAGTRPTAAAQVPIGGGVTITPRSSWGGDLTPRGPLPAEAPGDVRVLLVHHPVSAHRDPAADVPGLLRGIHAFHTGAEKGWPDIAYNFFVDAFGGVWEGRTGSIDAPVMGSATGGSQGFAQLCCFVGDHQTVAPTGAAQASMVALLAWLAGRYGIDPSPGATTTFTSRGSQRWPAGTSVTTATIAGHREMSSTVCPGDAAFVLVRESFPALARDALGVGPTTAVTPSTTGPTTTVPASSSTTPATPAPPPPPSSTAVTTAANPPGSPSTTTASSTSTGDGEVAATPAASSGSSPSSGGDGLSVPLGAAAVVCGAAGAALLLRSRRATAPG